MGPTEVEVTNEPTPLITIEGYFEKTAETIDQWVSIMGQIEERVGEIEEYIGQIEERVGEIQERIASYA